MLHKAKTLHLDLTNGVFQTYVTLISETLDTFAVLHIG